MLLSRVYLCIITAGIFRRFRMPPTVVTPDLRHAFTASSSFTTLSALGQKQHHLSGPLYLLSTGWLAACRLPIRSRMCWPNTRLNTDLTRQLRLQRGLNVSGKAPTNANLCRSCGDASSVVPRPFYQETNPAMQPWPLSASDPPSFHSEEKWCSRAAVWDCAHSGLRVWSLQLPTFLSWEAFQSYSLYSWNSYLGAVSHVQYMPCLRQRKRWNTKCSFGCSV